jgi:hypothetical protein
MPCQPDHWDAIIAVGGVLLGGMMSLAAATFVARREQKYRRCEQERQRRDRLLAKLDELSSEHQTISRWLSQFRTSETMSSMQSLHPTLPCSRMEALAAIYFESLEQPVAQYTAALKSYYTWAFSQVPHFAKEDRSFPYPLLQCLIAFDQEAAARHNQEIESCFRSLADSVAREAKTLLG